MKAYQSYSSQSSSVDGEDYNSQINYPKKEN